MTRSAWHARTGGLVLAWLLAALVVAAARGVLGESRWLIVHVLLLGAVTTALLVWTWHFSVAVLRAPAPASRQGEAVRIIAANIGTVGVLVGVTSGSSAVTLTGAVLLLGAITAHVAALVGRLRGALPARFAVTVHTYVAAGVLVLPGIALGVLLARGAWSPAQYSGLLTAHVSINLLGWVGLPILGTLVTLWPTMLRTKLDPSAERLARRALPILVAGTLITVVGAILAVPAISVAGLGAYAVGGGMVVGPMVLEARHRPPTTFAAWSACAGVVWLAGSLVGLGAAIVDPSRLSGSGGRLLYAALLGGIVQVLLGALSFLLPVMLGGGPAAVRQRIAAVDRALIVRVVLFNAGLLLGVLPVPDAASSAGWLVVVATALATVLLLAASLRPVRRPV